ncbi:MAG: bacillithiol system redox-active protein YtxJ [Arachidicoccus sp.]|nr:bacillithiol system redox-active protein YtxJ [Arachidicoccus sp.]
MNWIALEDTHQLSSIKETSFTKTQIIYKHSTTCSISKVVYARLTNWKENVPGDVYYLDLLSHRDVSNAVAEMFDIQHESPQILVIKNGICIYNESHTAIQAYEIAEYI